MSKGFTLIELLVSLAIAALIVGIAIPSYRAIVQENEASALGNSFVTAVYLARNTALQKGSSVSVCAAADSTLSSCGAAGSWTNGWLVFVDANGNGTVGTSANIVRVWQAPPVGTVITAATGRITYASTGFLSSGSGTYTLNANGCYGNNAQSIGIATNGRVSVSTAPC